MHVEGEVPQSRRSLLPPIPRELRGGLETAGAGRLGVMVGMAASGGTGSGQLLALGGATLAGEPGDPGKGFEADVAEAARRSGGDQRLPLVRRDGIPVAPGAGRYFLDADITREVGGRGPQVHDVGEGLHSENNTDCIEQVNTERIGRGRVAAATLCIAMLPEPPTHLTDPGTRPHLRLAWVRSLSFKSAAAFWRAHRSDIGISEPGYRHHENGHRPLKYGDAKRYGALLSVNPVWLMDGVGTLEPDNFSVHLDRVDAMLLPPDSGPIDAGEQSVETGELISVLREMAGAIRVLGDKLDAHTELLRHRLPEPPQAEAQVDLKQQAAPQRKPAKPAKS